MPKFEKYPGESPQEAMERISKNIENEGMPISDARNRSEMYQEGGKVKTTKKEYNASNVKPLEYKDGKGGGKTTVVVEVNTSEGKRRYKGEASKKSTQLARNTAYNRAISKVNETPADSLAGYQKGDLNKSKKTKTKTKKKKWRLW